MAEDERLTIDQAAQLAGKRPRTIRRWIAQGLLPGYRPKVGRGTVVKRRELLEAMQLVPIEPENDDDDDPPHDIVSGELPPLDDDRGM